MSLARRFGRTSQRRFAAGQDVRLESLPTVDQWVNFSRFEGGYDSQVSHEDTAQNTSAFCIDCEVNNKGRIIRAPGTTTLESLGAKESDQLVLHASLDARAELLVFAPPFLGVKAESTIVWTDVGLPVGPRYGWANYGGTLFFSNGRAKVFSREPKEAVREEPSVPVGSTFAAFAARLFVGAATIDGALEPMGLAWSSTSGNPADFEGDGSGAEVLINEMTVGGDRIVALRAMSLDFMAVVCRHSVWIGRFSGQASRPADFQPRVSRIGAVDESTVQLTIAGVAFLSDDGVRIFDGNEAQIVSHQINGDLLPLDYTNLRGYSSHYDFVTSRYFLFTPTDTWILDIEKKRWFRRSMLATSGAMFAQQFAGTTWAMLAGLTWAGLAGNLWSDYAPRQADLQEMLFLGRDASSDLLVTEDRDSLMSMDLIAVDPLWDFPRGRGQQLTDIFTLTEVHFEYAGDGGFELHSLDVNSNMDLIGSKTPLASVSPLTDSLLVLKSSLGIGVRLRLTTGLLELAKLQLGYARQGPRIKQTIITPAVANISVGETVQLTVNESGLSWITSDANVATVSSTGLVTAVGVGSATITAGTGSMVVTVSASSVPTELTIANDTGIITWLSSDPTLYTQIDTRFDLEAEWQWWITPPGVNTFSLPDSLVVPFTRVRHFRMPEGLVLFGESVDVLLDITELAHWLNQSGYTTINDGVEGVWVGVAGVTLYPWSEFVVPSV